MQPIYTVKEDPHQGIILQINGKDAMCPYNPAIAVPMQSALGGQSIGISRVPCSTTCPLAVYKQHASQGGMIYSISCGCEHQRFNITENEEPQKEEYKGLIALK